MKKEKFAAVVLWGIEEFYSIYYTTLSVKVTMGLYQEKMKKLKISVKIMVKIHRHSITNSSCISIIFILF